MFFHEKEFIPTYHLIDNPKKLSWLFNELRNCKEFSFDIENNHPTGSNNVPPGYSKKICGISFAWGRESLEFPWTPGNAAYIPMSRSDDSSYWGEEREKAVLDRIRDILESDIPKVAFNGKFDVSEIYTGWGVRTKNFVFDPHLAHTLIDEERLVSSHALKSDFSKEGNITKLGMSDVYLEFDSAKHKRAMDSAMDFYDPKYRRYSMVPVDILYPYGCNDADVTLSLKFLMNDMLEKEGLSWVYYNIVMRIQHVLMMAEIHGIPLDIERAKQIVEEQNAIMEDKGNEVYSIVGRKFDIGSATQLGKVLFEELGLRGERKESGFGWNTEAESLEKIEHPVVRPILDWKRANKITTSFAAPALEKMKEITNDGRIGWVHTTFYLDTLTGRIRGSDPNLMGLPKPENGGIVVKSMWAGDEDHRFIFKDYSQIELKFIAHCSGEPSWIEGFKQGHDMHSMMAHRIWHLDCSVAEVKDLYDDSRSKAKAINFGIAFGKSEYNLAKELDMTIEEASHLIHEEYFGAAPVLKRWIDEVHEFARENGYIYNLFGRIRHLPDAMLQPLDSVRWPKRENRLNCYARGFGSDFIGVSTEDMYNVSEADVKEVIYNKGNENWRKCLSCNYVVTCLINTEVKKTNSKIARAMRQAVNSPIQGGAVDMMSYAMVNVYDEILRQGLDAMPILHIHDEMGVFSHVNCVEQVDKIMDYYMTTWMEETLNFAVPLTVDTAIVRVWSEKHNKKKK